MTTKHYPLRALTLEESAFVDAYCDCVADAPREEVVRFIAVGAEARGDREFYDSISEYYTSLFDAREIWVSALRFVKDYK